MWVAVGENIKGELSSGLVTVELGFDPSLSFHYMEMRMEEASWMEGMA